MPILPNPRKLKRGHFWYGQSKFCDGWKRYNTFCQNKRHATDVVASIEEHCGYWPRAQRMLAILAEHACDEDVVEALGVIKAEIAAGLDPLQGKTGGTKFTEIAERYIRNQRTAWSRHSTISRIFTFRLFIQSCGDCSVKDIHQHQINTFREELLSRMSFRSVNTHLRNLRDFFRWAKAEILPDWKMPVLKPAIPAESLHLAQNRIRQRKVDK